jgi:Mn2+/Fe2+ NRAMP family transporter
MKRLSSLALGIVTSIGGYLDVGTIATSTEAGASFGFRLLWAMLVGAICLIVLLAFVLAVVAIPLEILGGG